MCKIKLLLPIAAFRDLELDQMDTATDFISAALKPGELIYCNPPSGVDLGIGSNGLPRVWKLRAPLEGTRPAAMRWSRLDKDEHYSHSKFWFCSYRFWGCFLDVSSPA